MGPKVYLDEWKLLRNLEDDIECALRIGDCNECGKTVYGNSKMCAFCGSRDIEWNTPL